QLAGHTCGHRPQATHLERPCSSVIIRWVPRQRVEIRQSSVERCSGYSSVTRGSNMCFKVSAMPLRVALTYETPLSGRGSTFTPIAISGLHPGTLAGHRRHAPDDATAVEHPEDD